MKKLLMVLVILAAAAAVPFITEAQNDQESLDQAVDRVIGNWKRNFAAPSYGGALFTAEITQRGLPGVSSPFTDDSFMVPAADLRIFRGVNVSKRGGFYTGIEAGAFIFLPFSHSFTADVSLDDTSPDGGDSLVGPLEFKVSPYGGIVFLMAKYGLRMDVGSGKAGLGAGFELGAGGSVYTGGFNLWTGDRNAPGGESDTGTGGTKLSMLVEGSAEGSFRVGKNFRMFAKGSVIITPVVLERMDMFMNPIANGMPNSLYELESYALSNYELDFRPFVYDLRLGFIVNFD